MGDIDWGKILAYILWLILTGKAKAEAVSMAASKFGVSESAIWSHGGF